MAQFLQVHFRGRVSPQLVFNCGPLFRGRSIWWVLNLYFHRATHNIRLSGTLLLIVLLWFGISAPLSAIGAYFGSRRGVRLSFRFD